MQQRDPQGPGATWMELQSWQQNPRATLMELQTCWASDVRLSFPHAASRALCLLLENTEMVALKELTTVVSQVQRFRIVVITSPCLCWISATLAAAFFCTVFLLALRLVSVVVLWFALPAVGSALLPAVGFALLPAVGFALLPAVGFARFFSSLLQIFDVLLARSSYPCCFTSFFSSFHHWLFGGGSVSVLSFFWRRLLQHNFGVFYCFVVCLMHLQRHHSACVTS